MLMAAIFCALLAMICINVPIAVALAMCGVIGLLAVEGTGSLVTIALDMYDGSTKFSLIAIPMFVLAGAIMNAGGITDRLINFVSAIIGFIRGGLAMVNIGVSLFFAEISGSAVADVAAMGSILIPQMKKRGYSKEFSAAVTSSSASLAIIIPPSIPMILYAASANTSVEQLFVAGVVPGLLGAAGLMGVAYAFAKRYDYPVEEAFNLPRVRETFKDALPAFALPVIILGGIFGGFVTATEAAGLAVLAAPCCLCLVSQPEPGTFAPGDARWRHTNRRGHAFGCRIGSDGRLLDPCTDPSATGGGDLVRHRSAMGDLADPELLFPDHRVLSAFGGRNHTGRPNCNPADLRCGNRSRAFWSCRYAEPGDRPTDTAGCIRSDNVLFGGAGEYLGRVESEYLLCRGPAGGADALHVRASGADVPR